MRVVLPREADPAEGLHAVLAVLERGVERECGGRRDRDAGAVVGLGYRARGVPHGRARELGPGEHVGAPVLDALELADRPTELHAHLGVLGRRVDTPLRDADGFRREQHRRELDDAFTVDREPPILRKLRIAELDARDPPRRVDALAARTDSVLASSAYHAPRASLTTRTSASVPPRIGSPAPSSTAPVSSPLTILDRSFSAAAPPAAWSTAAASTVGVYGPGAAARPSSSSTTACSTNP